MGRLPDMSGSPIISVNPVFWLPYDTTYCCSIPKLQINSHLNYRRYSSNFCMAYVTVDMFMWIGEQGGYKSIKKGKSSSRNFLLNWKL